MDARWTYSVAEVQELFDQLGEEGRKEYRRSEIRYDLLFPLIYGLLFMVVIAFLLTKSTPVNSIWRYAAVLPIPGILSDYLENFNILYLLDSYPELSPALIHYWAIFTQVKWSFVALSLGSIGVLLILVLLNKKIKA